MGILTIKKKKLEQQPQPKPKKQKVTVVQIHREFFTEVNRILEEAKNEHEIEVPVELMKKKERLANLGFTGTPEVTQAQEIESNKEVLEAENEKKQLIRDAVKYFGEKYPLYKFITEESIKKICEKYGLVYGNVMYFKGTIPEKNLKEMENFKIYAKDKVYIKVLRSIQRDSTKLLDYQEVLGWLKSNKNYVKHNLKGIVGDENGIRTRFIDGGKSEFIDDHALEIAGPPSDFDMNNMEVTDFKIEKKIEVPDPVVFHPVAFKGEKFYLIMTAWGDEASDPLVISPLKN